MYFSQVELSFGIVIIVFFFKQKTAYEMRISDWSSDVCSSDLPPPVVVDDEGAEDAEDRARCADADGPQGSERVGRCAGQEPGDEEHQQEIGRASCRERVCQYV